VVELNVLFTPRTSIIGCVEFILFISTPRVRSRVENSD
jgi:hypothetical protein